jgi:hypothetical protein
VYFTAVILNVDVTPHYQFCSVKRMYVRKKMTILSVDGSSGKLLLTIVQFMACLRDGLWAQGMNTKDSGRSGEDSLIRP